MTHDLSTQKILITGGTAGLGAALVRRATRAGAQVVFCGLMDTEGHAAANATGATYMKADVRDAGMSADFARRAADHMGGLTTAINNAGISHSAARFADIDLHVVRDVLSTNVMGVWNMMKAEIPLMTESGGGHILNVASVLSEEGAEWMAAYGTSKYALIGLTKSAALDYRSQRLQINAVSPGPMQTPMFDRAIEDIGGDLSKFAGGLPETGPSNPDDIAQEILDLAVIQDPNFTGQNILLGKSPD